MKTSPILLWTTVGLAIACASTAHADWKDLGLSGHDVTQLRSANGYLYACTNDGLHRKQSDTADSSWVLLGFAGQRVLDLLAISSDTLLASREITGISSDTVAMYRSVDGGSNWSPFQNGLGAPTGTADRRVIVLARPAATLPTIFVATRGGIAKSMDNGQSWAKITSGGKYHFLASRGSTLIGGGETSLNTPFVKRSTNGGNNWSTTYSSPLDDWAEDLAFDPGDINVAYLAVTSGIFRTDDNGASWNEVPVQAGSGVGTSALASRAYAPLRLYADGYGPPYGAKIVISDDGGLSWTSTSYLGAGSEVENVILVSSGLLVDSLFVGTASGVLRYIEDDAIVGVDPVAHLPRLDFSAYPNPLTDRVDFAFNLPHESRASLQVTDLTGRTVATVTVGEFPAGPHNASWHPGPLSAGIYFARLSIDRVSISRKILVVR